MYALCEMGRGGGCWGDSVGVTDWNFWKFFIDAQFGRDLDRDKKQLRIILFRSAIL